ncbi:MAG: hypothetical protein OXH80_04985 [Nitrospira sp.]|nr:hypothetical protein [Nitrospira sp.]
MIQEVTEEELRTALKTKNFREPLMEMIQSELQLAIKELANAPGPDRFSPRLFLKRANTAFAYHAGCL